MRSALEHLHTSELFGLGYSDGTDQLLQWSFDSNHGLDLRPNYRQPRLED